MQSCFGLGGRNGSLRVPRASEGREGAPPSPQLSQNGNPTQGLKDFPFPASPLAPCTPPDPHPTLGRAGQPGASCALAALLTVVHPTRSRAAAHGVGPQRGLGWPNLSPCCHNSGSLFHPSKAKDRTPELVRAGWGGNSAALILGTQGLLASQGAPSPLHLPWPSAPQNLSERRCCGRVLCYRDTTQTLQPQTPGNSPRHLETALPLARNQAK